MPLLTAKEQPITCPYEPSHRILPSRMQFHLVKCEYVNKAAVLQRCPFNSTHNVPEPELKYHMTYMCPDRIKMDTFTHRNDTTDSPLIPIQKIQVKSNTEESWDDDNDPTYNPLDHLQYKPILIHKQGVPPSERKEFRMHERQRHQQFQSKEHKNKSVPGCSEVPVERLPMTSSKAKEMKDKMPTVNRYNAGPVNNGNNNMGNPPFSVGRGRGRGRNLSQNSN